MFHFVSQRNHIRVSALWWQPLPLWPLNVHIIERRLFGRCWCCEIILKMSCLLSHFQRTYVMLLYCLAPMTAGYVLFLVSSVCYSVCNFVSSAAIMFVCHKNRAMTSFTPLNSVAVVGRGARSDTRDASCYLMLTYTARPTCWFSNLPVVQPCHLACIHSI